MNTMVEKKSAPSLANTSFIVLLSVDRVADTKSGSVGAGQGVRRRRTILRLAILWIPCREEGSAVAGGKGDHEAGPDRQARHVDRESVADDHQHESSIPGPGDEIHRL